MVKKPQHRIKQALRGSNTHLSACVVSDKLLCLLCTAADGAQSAVDGTGKEEKHFNAFQTGLNSRECHVSENHLWRPFWRRRVSRLSVSSPFSAPHPKHHILHALHLCVCTLSTVSQLCHWSGAWTSHTLTTAAWRPMKWNCSSTERCCLSQRRKNK